MRLLSYDSHDNLHVTRDLVDGEIPAYAILSHTWGADHEEVLFQDIKSNSYHSKAGYQKIELCGRQAEREGLHHFWVDTCCINKANNTELGKAILSMYRWYQKAQICYVYLTDVSSSNNPEADLDVELLSARQWESSFRKSRYFTRGWTLQELLAPAEVAFYSKEGVLLGTKRDLVDLLHDITDIPRNALLGEPPSSFSFDERMRWARDRATKEPEDQIYCLLGIFNIYMPLMYGEGENAFHRFKRKVAKQAMGLSRRSLDIQAHHDGEEKQNHDQVLLSSSQTTARSSDRASTLHNDNLMSRQMLQSGVYQIGQHEAIDISPRRLRAAMRWILSTSTLHFSFGKATVHAYRSTTHSANQHQWPGTNQARMNASFIPSRLFWQTRICLQAEWAVSLDCFAFPKVSLQFLDIVQDNHSLITASIKGDLSALQSILASHEVSPLCSTLEGWTPLHYAAASGQTGACKLLIAQGASLYATGLRGISPLHLAAHFGHLKVFRLLVEAGMDPGEFHDNGMNAMFELLSIGVGRAALDLTQFLHWLLCGQEQYLLDMRAEDNSGRCILYYLANPPSLLSYSSWALTGEQASAIGYVVQEGARGDELDFYDMSLLHEACRDNRMDLTTLLLSGSCNVDNIDGRGYSALHHAVRSGNIEMVSLLIERGANVNIEAKWEYFFLWTWGERPTPLYLAARFGYLDMVQLLIRHGAGLHGKYVSKAFYAALSSQHDHVARYFLEHRRNQLDFSLAINVVEAWTDMIVELHNAGAPLDQRDDYGFTPLLRAAQFNWIDTARILVELGADLNLAQGSETPLYIAVSAGYADVALLLLRAGATQTGFTNGTIRTLAQIATSRGHDDIIDLLNDYDTVKLRCSDSSRSTSDQEASDIHETGQNCGIELDLTESCATGNLVVVDKLLRNGCSLRTGKDRTWSPLSTAINNGHWDIVQRLVEAGAELNFCGEIIHSLFDIPFLFAMRYDNPTMITLMIAHGADVNIRGNYAETPLLQCLDRYWSGNTNTGQVCESNGPIVRALLEAGACPNVVDKYGRTPLGKAAAVGNLSAVVALVEAGAEIDKLASQNSSEPMILEDELTFRSPIAWAAVYGHEHVVRYLFQSGAEWRCLRNEPAVWYTHRLLMESTFSSRTVHDTPVKTKSVRPASATSECTSHSEHLSSPPVQNEAGQGSPIQSVDTGPTSCSDEANGLRRVIQTCRGCGQRLYAYVQSWRYEVAAFACVMTLLLCRRAMRYLWKNEVESLRVAALAMLAGVLLTSWMNGAAG